LSVYRQRIGSSKQCFLPYSDIRAFVLQPVLLGWLFPFHSVLPRWGVFIILSRLYNPSDPAATSMQTTTGQTHPPCGGNAWNLSTSLSIRTFREWWPPSRRPLHPLRKGVLRILTLIRIRIPDIACPCLTDSIRYKAEVFSTIIYGNRKTRQEAEQKKDQQTTDTFFKEESPSDWHPDHRERGRSGLMFYSVPEPSISESYEEMQ
jgi:hypothetical protein